MGLVGVGYSLLHNETSCCLQHAIDGEWKLRPPTFPLMHSLYGDVCWFPSFPRRYGMHGVCRML